MDFCARSEETATTMSHGAALAFRYKDILPIGYALARIVPQRWADSAQLVVVHRDRNTMPLQFLNRLFQLLSVVSGVNPNIW
jgi:hypothetical protein